MHTRTLLAVLMVVAVACSGSDGADDTTSTTTSTPAASTTVATTAAPTTTIAQTTTTEPRAVGSEVFVTTVGLGEVRVGMTLEEARAAAPYALVGEPDPVVSETCFHLTPDDPFLDGVAFMVEDGRIVRVEVRSPSVVSTRSGARLGMSADEIRAMFPGQIEDAAEYTIDGSALQFVPVDEGDQDYRVVFELIDDEVTGIRAGILPAVGYGEGCV